MMIEQKEQQNKNFEQFYSNWANEKPNTLKKWAEKERGRDGLAERLIPNTNTKSSKADKSWDVRPRTSSS